MYRVGQTKPGVLPRYFLLLEVDQGLVEAVLQVLGDLFGFVLLGTQDGVTSQLLLHLTAFVSKIINFQSRDSAMFSSALKLPTFSN